jgi:hypothetical protein
VTRLSFLDPIDRQKSDRIDTQGFQRLGCNDHDISLLQNDGDTRESSGTGLDKSPDKTLLCRLPSQVDPTSKP